MVNGIVVAIVGAALSITQILVLFVLTDLRGRIMRLESKQMGQATGD
jgi:hypothetical protein